MMPEQIKQVIFDLGGVLLNIDFQQPVQAFANLGYPNFESLYGQKIASPLFEQLETGQISNTAFLQKIEALLPQQVSHQQIIDAWNSIILGFRLSSLAYLDQLASRYKIYLFSNTSAIHFDRIQSFYQQQTGLPSLDHRFTKAWYSYRIGFRKPHQQAYEFVLGEENLQPEETLFIDDSPQNIATAEKMGIQTHLLLPGQLIEDLKLI